MADTLNIACPNCETPFEVPVEMIGETVECTECGSAFEILAPEPMEEVEANGNAGDLAVELPEEEETGSTHTVKMSRTSIGMVPTIEDTYNLDVVDQHIQKTDLRKSFESGEYAIGKQASETQEGDAIPEGEDPDKKWWKFWKKQ